ncbi:hydroxyacid dehydrogenase [Patescibacteria group bacterium]|nr:hydroxyacid dehydrogenase [Patescibacteria group bacterium]
MKILFCEVPHVCNDLDWEGQYLKEKLCKDDECFFTQKVAGEYNGELSDIEVLSTFIHTQVNRELLSKMPGLKLVVTRSTGYDHVDVEECQKRGIEVCNVPFYGENTVAEYAFALLLALGRKMYEAYDRVLKSEYTLEGLMGFDLMGKTLGIIGGGHIGIHAVRIGVGFGMKVLCYDVKPNEELAAEIGFEYVELDKLYKESDVISLHVPLIPPTKHMINQGAFDKMKDGVILINTARGGIVETKAMMEALDSGKLGGAGLDVLEDEEFLANELHLADEEQDPEKLRYALLNHILMDNPNVLITFHNAFNTKEGRTRILDTTVENVVGFKDKKIVNNVIKK